MASIYDAAVNVYSRNFSLVVAAIALITVPANLVGGLIEEQGGVAGQVVGVVIDGVAVFLATAMAAIIVDELIAGRTLTVGRVWRRMGRLLWPLVATFVLYALAVVGGFALVRRPGVSDRHLVCDGRSGGRDRAPALRRGAGTQPRAGQTLLVAHLRHSDPGGVHGAPGPGRLRGRSPRADRIKRLCRRDRRRRDRNPDPTAGGLDHA